MISMKNYGKKHSQPLLIIHINTKVPLGTLLFPDKPVYLWFSSWHKRCSIQRRLLRSPHVHQQHELFLPPALLLSSQRRLSQLQKQIGNVHTGREDKQTVGCSSDLVSSCKHKMSEQRLHWNFHLQNARKKKKRNHHWWSLEHLVASTSYSPVASSRNLWLVLSSAISGQPKYDRMTDSPFNRYWQTN